MGTILPRSLEEQLTQFDQSIDQALEKPLYEVSKKSKALSRSLARSFRQARLSERFDWVYQRAFVTLGKVDKESRESRKSRESKELKTENLIKEVNLEFEEIDFLVFREFARLLRACSLHIDPEISAEIKKNFKKTFRTERLELVIDFVRNNK